MATLSLGAAGEAESAGQATLTPPTTVWPQGSGWQHLLTSLVVVQHIGEPTRDAYGNALPGVGSVDIVYGYLEPISETIHLVEADTLVTTHQLILPPQITLTADDTVIVDNTPFRVIESLHISNARSGLPHHVEAKVVQVSG